MRLYCIMIALREAIGRPFGCVIRACENERRTRYCMYVRTRAANGTCLVAPLTGFNNTAQHNTTQ